MEAERLRTAKHHADLMAGKLLPRSLHSSEIHGTSGLGEQGQQAFADLRGETGPIEFGSAAEMYLDGPGNEEDDGGWEDDETHPEHQAVRHAIRDLLET